MPMGLYVEGLWVSITAHENGMLHGWWVYDLHYFFMDPAQSKIFYYIFSTLLKILIFILQSVFVRTTQL